MIIAVQKLFEIKEGDDRYNEWRSGVGIHSSDGDGLEAYSTGRTVDIAMESTNFSVSYKDGKASARLHRTFWDTNKLREFANALLHEADAIDADIARWEKP